MTSPRTEPTPGDPPDGVLVVDKAPGWTSHQVVSRARRLLGTRKVGHAGTLDPMATGVLLLGVGRATRLLGHLMRTDKEYRATIRFGMATITDDAEGEPTSRTGAQGLELSAVEQLLPRYRGAIEQVPTQVSAIKINGIRSYARVRDGDQVELAARPVRIEAFEIGSSTATMIDNTPVLDVDVRVVCSSGTYIRALARDLGDDLGTGAHLSALRRTRSGDFVAEEGVRLDEADVDEPDLPAWRSRLMTPAQAVRRSLPVLELDAAQSAEVRYGRALPGLVLPGDVTGLLDPSGDLLALYRPGDDAARPVAVFVP